MRVFTCNDFKGIWPVGAAAVIVAAGPSEAALALRAELEARKIPQDNRPLGIEEVLISMPSVNILCDGNY